MSLCNCGCGCYNDCGCGCNDQNIDPCTPRSLCSVKVDTNCIFYNFTDPNASNCFTALGIANGTPLTTILCAIDAYLGSLSTVQTFSASSNSLVITPGGTHGFNPEIELVPSTDANNILILGTDGHPLVTKPLSTTYISTDAGNSIVLGTDSKLFSPQVSVATNGCLSFAHTVVGGVSTFTPTIDYTCLSSHLTPPTGNFWSLTGNTGTTPGTNFLGTIDDKDLIFKRNTINSGLLNASNFCTAFGVGALASYSVGMTSNTAVGTHALNAVISGDANVAIGDYALAKTTTSNNTAVGNGALTNNVGGLNNTALGQFALGNNINGNYNIGIGVGVMGNSGSGTNNIAIGNEALPTLTSGTFNTIIGDAADVSATSTNYGIAIGANAIAASNQLTLSPQVQTIKAVGLPTAAGSVLTDVAGDGNLSLHPLPVIPAWVSGAGTSFTILAGSATLTGSSATIYYQNVSNSIAMVHFFAQITVTGSGSVAVQFHLPVNIASGFVDSVQVIQSGVYIAGGYSQTQSSNNVQLITDVITINGSYQIQGKIMVLKS